jgi:hypothetical protein
MIALDIMLAALAQAPVSAPAQGASPVPVPNVEVVGPNLQRRVICHTITPSGSHITARRICRTAAQIEEARDRLQRDAAEDLRSTNQRTNNMLVQSNIGGRQTPVGIADVRQERRGGD